MKAPDKNVSYSVGILQGNRILDQRYDVTCISTSHFAKYPPFSTTKYLK